MDGRLRFVARLLEGEKMAGLRQEFGISRKTGYRPNLPRSGIPGKRASRRPRSSAWNYQRGNRIVGL